MRYVTNIFIAVLLLAGLGVLSYPTVSNWLALRNHSQAIQEYGVTVEQLTARRIEEERDRARRYNRTLEDVPLTDAFVPNSVAHLPDDYRSTLNIGGMIGYVHIPAIDVNLPIYHLTSEEVLLKGVGHMDATAFPIGGEGNHPVLTAHRGLPSAKLFTDLNRLEEGDLFFLHVLDEVLAYRVDRQLVVEPGDTEELRPVAGEDRVTLVTCTPYAINSHRLLVRGTREELPDEALPALEQAIPKRTYRWVWVAAAGVAGAGGLAGARWRRRSRRKGGQGKTAP